MLKNKLVQQETALEKARLAQRPVVQEVANQKDALLALVAHQTTTNFLR